MEQPKKDGVLDLLGVLEVRQGQRKRCHQDHELEVLKERVEALVIQRDQLKAKMVVKTAIQKILNCMEQDGPCDEEILDGTENSQILLLMARHTQLKDLISAHHLTGGYDEVRTHKGVCVSVATAFEGVYLDMYNLEINLSGAIRVSRHNIPQAIALGTLSEQCDMPSDLLGFLDTLSQHLNAYAGRKRQLALVKELHDTVQVMESNQLYTILVLMFSLPGDTSTAVLCTLNYEDTTQCLPTRVSFESNEVDTPCLSHWKERRAMFLESPVHEALATLRKTGLIN